MTEPKVTVYSKPFCVQCNATYRALDKQGTPYETVDISNDLEALNYVMRLNPDYKTAPIVVVERPVTGANDQTYRESWSGFNPERINELKGDGVDENVHLR